MGVDEICTRLTGVQAVTPDLHIADLCSRLRRDIRHSTIDERGVITRLAEIRESAVGSPLAVKAIDSLMQEMTFGNWPYGDATKKPTPVPEPSRKMEFFL